MGGKQEEQAFNECPCSVHPAEQYASAPKSMSDTTQVARVTIGKQARHGKDEKARLSSVASEFRFSLGTWCLVRIMQGIL